MLISDYNIYSENGFFQGGASLMEGSLKSHLISLLGNLLLEMSSVEGKRHEYSYF